MAWAFMSGKTEPRHAGRGSASLRARAMRFLARREHSRAELKRKLEPRVGEGDDLEQLLDDLTTRGWLSDMRFAEISIRSRSGRYGPLRLVHQLRTKGVAEETIDAAFKTAGANSASSIEKVWSSRFDIPAADDHEHARHVRFLQGRGFSLEDVLHFLKRNPTK